MTTQAAQVDLDAIPPELAARDQWLVWRYEEVPGKAKPTKVPYQAANPTRRASTTDPATWASLHAAAAAWLRGDADGFGFVFSADDPFAGVDLDDCFEDDGELHPVAAAIVARLDSYTELSPSRGGLHVLVRAAMTGTRKRTKQTPWGGEFEAYDGGRYFTVTGDHWRARRDIESRQSELEAVLGERFPVNVRPGGSVNSNGGPPSGAATLNLEDDEVLQRALDAPNGAKVQALWTGDTSGYGDDHSRADCALLGLLAFWTGPDPAQLDRLFRGSGLMRDKWEREDYAARTIAKALERTEFYSGDGHQDRGAQLDGDRARGHDADADGGEDPAPARKKSQATRLVELAESDELFHAPSGEAFARFDAGGHQEVAPVRARPYRARLARLHYEHQGTAPSTQAVQDAIAVLEGRALYEGTEYPVATRVAELDGAIYLDLADPAWGAVEITSAGWRVVHESPVRFRRPKGMEPLPSPLPGGNLEELRALVNLSDGDWPLFVGWLLAAHHPRGPYPLLAFEAEQGTAKSTTARFSRRLIDPNAADLRAAPRNAHDLILAATNGWVVALDNVSSLQPWLSDGLCRLATGGGLATRTLYENNEESIFYAQRPALVTAIAGVATRGDLIDRSVVLQPPLIPDHKRLTERELWRRFEAIRPYALGALLNGVSRGLADLDSVDLTDPPRLADFAEWVAAAAPGVGIQRRAFLDAYSDNRQLSSSAVLDGSPAARALLIVADEGYEGSASELLPRLMAVAEEAETRHEGWPRSPQAAGQMLARLAPNLRDAGYEVENSRDGSRRRWSIRRGRETNVTNVTAVTQGVSGDGNDVRDVSEPPNSHGGSTG